MDKEKERERVSRKKEAGMVETRRGKIRISNPIFRGIFNRHPSAAAAAAAAIAAAITVDPTCEHPSPSFRPSL